MSAHINLHLDYTGPAAVLVKPINTAGYLVYDEPRHCVTLEATGATATIFANESQLLTIANAILAAVKQREAAE